MPTPNSISSAPMSNVGVPAAGEHLVGDGRGEDLAGAGGVEHSEPDEPSVHGLVAGPTAGDEPDLAGHRCVLPHDDLVLEVDPDKVGMGGVEAGQRFLDDVFG